MSRDDVAHLARQAAQLTNKASQLKRDAARIKRQATLIKKMKKEVKAEFARSRGAGGCRSKTELMEAVGAEMRSYQTTLDAFDEAVSEFLGLNRTDLRCMDILDQNEPMTAGGLARATGLTSGAVTFLLDRMEHAGFVRRMRDVADRRRVLVEQLPEAKARAWKIYEPIVKDGREAMNRFTTEELRVVKDFLRLSRELYEKHLPRVKEEILRRSESRPGV